MDRKLIAITFDDGPNTSTTMEVLDILEKHNAIASFFLVGNNITEESITAAERAHKMGCEICNHSKTHSAMPELSADEIRSEIEFTSKEIEKITGCMPKFFRPPYIAVSKEMYDAVGLPFIAGFGCNDWDESVSTEERFNRTMEQAAHGGIILLHDMQGNSKTVAALDMLIPALKSEGFELVNVSDLFRLCGISPVSGIVYSNVFQQSEYF